MSPKSLASYVPFMAKKVEPDRGLTYRIIAFAVSKKGNILGFKTNGHRFAMSHRRGAGLHAEAELIKLYGKKIDKIYLLRLGNALDPLPIHPCENCAKIAAKMGIKIILLKEEIKDIGKYIK